MLPAPLKKLRIVDVRPVSPDRIYFNFHLRSANSQKPSTIALWTRGDKKPFPTGKLTHYAHASCLLDDGRLLALNSNGPSTAFEGLEASTFDTPVIEDNSWMAGAVVAGDLVLAGNWGNLQRRDSSGAWHTLSKPDELPRIRSVAVHASAAVIGGDAGLLMHVTTAGLAKIEHEKGSADIREVCCRADGTIVAVAGTAFVHGPLGSTLAKVDHPSGKDFLSVAEAGGTLYLSADDGLYQFTGGALQTIACPIRPTPLLTLRSLGDALYVFNDDAVYLRAGADWTQVA